MIKMSLFEIPPYQTGNKDLDQYFTPEWAAIELVETYFPELDTRDVVLEPCCGLGSFLKAIPQHVEAIGIEIDKPLADAAGKHTGRKVYCGDFREIKIPEKPTAIIGNPPYKMQLLNDLLDRAHDWLPENGRCGLILSTHLIQTPSSVLRWNERWSLDQRIMPRTLFPRAKRPLVFMMFQKDRLIRAMGGFALYRQSAEINDLAKAAKILLINGQPGKTCWRAVVEWALRSLGGRAQVKEIYDRIEPHRPSDNRWWQEKIRQTLQRHFVSVDRGIWSLN